MTMVIFGNLLILVNLVISVIFSDYCESDGSGDSGAYGHSCDSGDCIESAHSCEYGASGDFDKNGYSVDSGKFGYSVEFCDSGNSGELHSWRLWSSKNHMKPLVE